MPELDRLLVKVQAVLSLAMAVFVLAANLSANTGNRIWRTLMTYIDSSELTIVVAAYAILSIWLLSTRTKEKEPLEPYLVQRNHLGEIQISATTVTSFIVHALREIDTIGVESALVTPGKGGAVVDLRVTVSPTVNIPEIAALIQQSVKTGIEDKLSLQVETVRVNFSNAT